MVLVTDPERAAAAQCQHDGSGAQVLTSRGQGVDEPGHRSRRMSHHRGTGRGADHLSPRAENTADKPQVFKLGDRACARSERDLAGADVIGNHIGQPVPEVFKTGVNDLNRREHLLGGRKDARDRGRMRLLLAQHNGDLWLRLRVNQLSECHRLTVRKDHPGGEPSANRLVDARAWPA